MRLAVIPARGGSKRIPRKNIRPFAGRPMITYAIGAALASEVFDQVIVSTDDAEIAEIARVAGAQVPFTRPAELADDITPTVPVIAHAINALMAAGLTPAQVCCIYPGVPLLSPQDLVQGLELLEQAGQGYAFPVTPFPSPIQRALRRHEDGRTEPFDARHVGTRTQDLEPAYHDSGQFYWGATPSWLGGLNIHQNARTFVIPEWRCVDIDTLDDWLRAEALYGVLHAKDHP